MTVSISYQTVLYLLIRMGRGGFTLGEVGLVAQATTVLILETVNLTEFRVCAQLLSLPNCSD
jgi:dolichol kinase